VSYRPFRDRRDASRVLAGLLDEYRGHSDVIVAAPRSADALRSGRLQRAIGVIYRPETDAAATTSGLVFRTSSTR
jgi:hypothetical protein